MAGCVENLALMNARYTGPKLRRDGAPHKLQVMLRFGGTGDVDVQVYVDGAGVLGGRYQPSSDPRFVSSRRFYLKHGVYSRNAWPYEMVSQEMRVLEARE